MSERIKRGEKVPVRLLRGERQLIVEHTCSDNPPFKEALMEGSEREVNMSMADLVSLLRRVVAAANQCGDHLLENRLDGLYDRLDAIYFSYEEVG
jgi:hypothetical protein